MDMVLIHRHYTPLTNPVKWAFAQAPFASFNILYPIENSVFLTVDLPSKLGLKWAYQVQLVSDTNGTDSFCSPPDILV